MNSLLLPLATLSLATALLAPLVQEDQSAFSRTTIDVGMVVSDIDAAANFYSKLVGFTEVKGFTVGGDFSKSAGLTSGIPLSIRVFVLGAGEDATKLKIMQAQDVESKKSDNTYVHSQLGLSYITIFVKDLTPVLDRLGKAGIKVLGEGPVAIGGSAKLAVVHDPDGNMVELIGPQL